MKNNYEHSERPEFTVHKSYNPTPATLIVCAECGTDKLHVGISHDFVAIKCPNCGWEQAAHG